MILTITPSEREMLSILGREAERKKAEYEAAVRDFKLAFEMGMRARDLTDMSFVKLDGDGLHVEAASGPKLVTFDPEDAA